jgi:hypothetical protein
MKPFRRTPPVSWAAELVELAAVFLAVGVAHLFVSLVGQRAHGAVMLIISGVALILGAVVHRRWAATRARRAEPALPNEDLLGDDRRVWRLRTTLRDRPGSLAALTGKLAALKVNILAIQVHPTRLGVVDELFVTTPPGVTVKEIAAAVDAGGGTGIEIVPADRHDLVDPPSRALLLARQVADGQRTVGAALAELLGAGAAPAGDGTRFVDETGTVAAAVSRPTLPFTPAELARARAFVELCARLDRARR